MPGTDIRANVLKVLHESYDEKWKKGLRLQVMTWIVNGKEGKPIVANQEIYRDEAGTLRTGKMKGLNKESLWKLLQHLPEVAHLMDIDLETFLENLAQTLKSAQVAPTATTVPTETLPF